MWEFILSSFPHTYIESIVVSGVLSAQESYRIVLLFFFFQINFVYSRIFGWNHIVYIHSDGSRMSHCLSRVTILLFIQIVRLRTCIEI